MKRTLICLSFVMIAAVKNVQAQVFVVSEECGQLGYGYLVLSATAIQLAGNIDELTDAWESIPTIPYPGLRQEVTRNLANYQRQIKSRMAETQIICVDDSPECVAAAYEASTTDSTTRMDQLGYPTLGKLNLCYFVHLFSSPSDQCALLDTIIHEMLHFLRVPMAPGHNSEPDRDGDPVYMLAGASGDRCRQLAARGLFRNDDLRGDDLSGSVNLRSGDTCLANSQCGSGRCANRARGPRQPGSVNRPMIGTCRQ